MTKYEIINKLATEHKVEDIARNIAKSDWCEDMRDMCQDIYLELMRKDDKLIESLFQKNQLDYFLTKMLLNNIKSETSPYYYNYVKWTKNKNELINGEYEGLQELQEL